MINLHIPAIDLLKKFPLEGVILNKVMTSHTHTVMHLSAYTRANG